MSFPHKIKPGIYKLPVDLKSHAGWIDKRLKGTGFRTSSGFSAGTEVLVQLLESGKLTRTDVEEVLAMLKEKGS